MRCLTVFLLLLLTAPVSAGERSLIKNGDFENVNDHGFPRDWVSAQHAGGRAFEFTTDEDKPHKGERSMRVRRTKPQVWGLTEQIIDGTDLVGKTLTFSLAARSEEVGEQGATIYLSAFSGTMLLSTADVRIHGTEDWREHTLTLEIPERTTRLRVGVTLEDAGTVWIDAAKLVVVKADKT